LAASLAVYKKSYLTAIDFGAEINRTVSGALPTADNTHDVAQREAPEARIVYVDHDPVVISHARALLTTLTMCWP
jgi:S-adenosyl methyltransferase